MHIVRDDLWLCVDCLMAAVNGDFTGLDATYSESEANERMRQIETGLDALGPHLVPDFDSETGDGIEEFMRPRLGCACCGSKRAGTFHRFAVLGPDKPQPPTNEIRFNASQMFAHREPWDCSNSIANLGASAGRLTWGCAMEIAADHADWLLTPLADAVALIRADAASYGAWDREEIANWTEQECLALFVQNVASDLRLLGSDAHDLSECVRVQDSTDWDSESEYPITSFNVEGSHVMGARYMGI